MPFIVSMIICAFNYDHTYLDIGTVNIPFVPILCSCERWTLRCVIPKGHIYIHTHTHTHTQGKWETYTHIKCFLTDTLVLRKCVIWLGVWNWHFLYKEEQRPGQNNNNNKKREEESVHAFIVALMDLLSWKSQMVKCMCMQFYREWHKGRKKIRRRRKKK